MRSVGLGGFGCLRCECIRYVYVISGVSEVCLAMYVCVRCVDVRLGTSDVCLGFIRCVFDCTTCISEMC